MASDITPHEEMTWDSFLAYLGMSVAYLAFSGAQFWVKPLLEVKHVKTIDLRIYYTRIYIYIYIYIWWMYYIRTYIRIFSHEFRLAFIKQVGLVICSHHGTFTCWDWLDGRSDSLDRDGANPLEETPTCGGREGENTDPKHLISSSERKWKGQDNKECKLNPIKAAIHSWLKDR